MALKAAAAFHAKDVTSLLGFLFRHGIAVGDFLLNFQTGGRVIIGFGLAVHFGGKAAVLQWFVHDNLVLFVEQFRKRVENVVKQKPVSEKWCQGSSW